MTFAIRPSLSCAFVVGALALLGACDRRHHDRRVDADPAVSNDTTTVEASMATCSDIGGQAERRVAACTAVIQSSAEVDIRAKAFNNRGVLLSGQGDDDRAIADYNEAVRLSPQYDAAFYNRSQSWRRKGDRARADADSAQAVRLNPSLAGH